MEENQLEGTEKADAIVSQEIIGDLNTVLKNILKAWNLIPLLYPDSIGKLHDAVAQICAKNYDKDDKFSKLLRYLAKIPYHIEEGLRLNLVNKLESSFKDYNEANNFCNATLKWFQEIKDTMPKKIISIFPITDFVECCRSITSILKDDSYNVLECKNGKYINQAKRFRNLAGHFRTFSTDLIRLDNKNEKLNEELSNMSILAKRVADMCEEKAQEIEADKKIRFMNPTSNEVFIVHGHNMDILDELKEFLEKSCGIKPIVLSEMPDKGETVIDKFEHYGKDSSFAFVIMTKDDIVTVKKDKKTYEQGRPNVLFELGWFRGRYGRDRVRILKQRDVKIPTDLEGILTIDFKKSLKEKPKKKEESPFDKIKKELKHSGFIISEEKNKSEEDQE